MSAYPDLILLDGGQEHVNVIRRMMADYGYDIPVFGMVKDEHHKTRTLVDGEGELNIARHADVFRLIYGIQEEVHRYSVSRMTNAKRKTLKTSSLEKINGIGPAKAKALMSHFGTIKAIKNASLAELENARGISKADAAAIYEYYKKDN